MKKLKEMDKHMKRWIVILITALAAMLAVDVCAQEPQRGVKISGGADIVSGYVWRGVWESGACIQPVMTLSAGNFSATAWGSVDFAATSYKEMDLTLAYALGPVTFSLADPTGKAARATGARSAATISASGRTLRTASRRASRGAYRPKRRSRWLGTPCCSEPPT